jgi:hypothetical protein
LLLLQLLLLLLLLLFTYFTLAMFIFLDRGIAFAN